MRFGLILLVALLASPAFAESPKTAAQRVIDSGILRCGYATSPPVLIKDPNTGKLSGSDVEIVEAIGKKLNLKVEWTEEVGWGNFIEGLRTNRYDMMCGSLWPDAQRIKYLSFTRPVYFDRMLAYARADDTRFDDAVDKINTPSVKIAVLDGDASTTMAKDKFPQAALVSLSQMAVVSDMILSVITKKADIIFMDPVRIAVFEKENKGKIKRIPNIAPVTVIGTSFGVRASEFQLRDMIDTALRELINEGEVAKLLAKTSKDLIPPAKGY